MTQVLGYLLFLYSETIPYLSLCPAFFFYFPNALSVTEGTRAACSTETQPTALLRGSSFRLFLSALLVCTCLSVFLTAAHHDNFRETSTL